MPKQGDGSRLLPRAFTSATPLPNRVDPMGALFATEVRGAFMGNRGRFHRADGTLGKSRWSTRRWICCALSFKNRSARTVWGSGYTELFFHDEVTAFAAGHRPCFECRRSDASAFMAAAGFDSVEPMDRALDSERREGHTKRTHPMRWGDLPAGAVALVDGVATLGSRTSAFMWTKPGWQKVETPHAATLVEALTPPTTIKALLHGYCPDMRL
jgi:hypothetical protein